MLKRPDINSLTRPQRYGLLAALYFSQGVPFGLFMQALPVILREQGVSLEAIGFTALLALPWGLKFLWSPWVDRRPPLARSAPRRKGWLVPIQIVTAGVFVALAAIEVDQNIAWLLGAVFAINLLNATQDIATDGLAVDILDVDERGAGNGLQVGGYRVGMIAGGAGVLVLIEALGWTTGLLACAALLAAALVPLLWVREDPTPDRAPHTRSGVATLWSFFEQPWGLIAVALVALFKFGDSFAVGMLRPMLVDEAYSMGEIGWMVGGVGFTFGLLGAVAGGLLGDRLRRARALLVAVICQVGGVALYIPLAAGDPGVVEASALVAIEHFAGGIATVILFACMMDWTRSEHTGTDYTVLASVVVLSTGFAHALSGISAQHLGYSGHFVLAAMLTLAGGVAALWMYSLTPTPDSIQMEASDGDDSHLSGII
jgi:RhtX/FptX family siderophore transporter